MEKKQYIMPSVRVKAVNMLLMQGSVHDIIGGGENFSKGVDLPEDNGNEGVDTHDVWED